MAFDDVFAGSFMITPTNCMGPEVKPEVGMPCNSVLFNSFLDQLRVFKVARKELVKTILANRKSSGLGD